MAALFVLLVLMAFAFVLDCFLRAVKAVRKTNRVIDEMPLPPSNVTPLHPDRPHVKVVGGTVKVR